MSVTEKESKNGEHGSEFTATFPLGKDHLPATQLLGVEPNLTTKKKSYARGIVAEAARWRVIGDSSSPSDDSYGSSEVPISRDFNFQESDLVLLGELVGTNADADSHFPKLTIIKICWVRSKC